MNQEYLFVYGLLRQDSAGEMYHLLAQHAEFVDEGYFQGKLFLVDYYPGAVPSENTEDLVRGEVYRLRNPEILLPRLDAFEECGPGFPEPAEYVRCMMPVTLRTGSKLEAWIYLYNHPTDDLVPIESGDFLKLNIS